MNAIFLASKANQEITTDKKIHIVTTAMLCLMDQEYSSQKESFFMAILKTGYYAIEEQCLFRMGVTTFVSLRKARCMDWDATERIVNKSIGILNKLF